MSDQDSRIWDAEMVVYMSRVSIDDVLAASQQGYAAGVFDGLVRVFWYFVITWAFL